MGPPIKGVVVQINSKESVPAALEEFIAMMKETGITPTGQINGSVPPSEIANPHWFQARSGSVSVLRNLHKG
jgi:hypothetical protein